MSKPISQEMQNKFSNNRVSVKDSQGKIKVTKDNPFIGRLLKHEYQDASNPQYGNDEGKTHILTWLTREEGERVEKKQFTSSDWFMRKLIEAHKEADTWDFKWWYEQQGPKNTVPQVEPYEEQEPEPEPDTQGPQDWEAGKDPRENGEEEVNVENIPF